jgi:outer membrane protein assembly factor BamA
VPVRHLCACALLAAAKLAAAESERILPSAGARVTQEGVERPSSLPSDQELEAAGAVVGDIEVRITNIFDTSLSQENTSLFRLANRLHIKTRENTIRQRLLFAPGESYSARTLAETERLLRRTRFLRAAYIRPVAYHDGRVDILVVTQDVWTLNPGISFSRKGGKNTAGVRLEELNLLGFGSQLQASYESGVDRDSRTVAFRDPHLAGSWWALATQYSDNSDGQTKAFSLERPFYSLNTRRAGGGSFFDERRIDSQYDLGHIANQYQTHQQLDSAYVGWSAGLRDGWVQRWRFGWTYDRNEFESVVSSHPSAPPSDRKLSYPWVGWQLTQDNWTLTRNRDQIERVEDQYLGWSIYATLGEAQPAFGADRVSVIYSASVAKGFTPTATQTFLWSAGGSGRYEEGQAANAVVTTSGRYYWRQSSHRTFFASAEVDAGSNLDADNPIQLGGDTGLRGYPLRYQNGEGRWLVTAEERFFTNWFPFRLFNVGGAVFADVGRTWGPNPLGPPSLGVLKDVGFGLRLGNTRSALGNVLHIDVAFPLDGDPSIKSVQFVVETKASF